MSTFTPPDQSPAPGPQPHPQGPRRLRHRAALLLGVATLLTAPCAASADDPRAETLAQALLVALHEASGVPGLSAAVWQDGRLLWQGQAGWQDLAARRPLGPETRLRLASVSKVLTATAAAWLHQQGRLDGEAPLARPWYPAEDEGARITPRQLAAHLSGLPHYQAVDLMRGRQAHADSDRAAQHWLQGRALLDKPGHRYRYSSWGYTLLGAAIEEASGLPLAEFIETQIAPGLAIGADRTDTDRETHSRPYEPSPAGWRVAPPHDYSYSLGGAGLSATPAALAAWGGRLLQGRLLTSDTLAWMTTPSRLVDGGIARHGSDAVGFGWRLRDPRQGRVTWFHNGSAIGARSALVLWPGTPATSAALLSNASWVSAIDDSARTLAGLFLPSPSAVPPKSLACPAAGQRFSGRWGEQRIEGTVQGSPDMPGPCPRRLVLDHQPPGFDNGGPRRPPVALSLVALLPGPDLTRAALATPIGLFQLEATGDSQLAGSVAGREWVLGFHNRSAAAAVGASQMGALD
ncbi:serine hydrolase domain-containing protein [Rubrivivax sp. RP6-9]|uniref:serine hydrolase domain-containing protein n=1 Tax=Rubrivivax sp. RP6-9 TaxID=3415750 RepID=UPI003CC5C421